MHHPHHPGRRVRGNQRALLYNLMVTLPSFLLLLYLISSPVFSSVSAGSKSKDDDKSNSTDTTTDSNVTTSSDLLPVNLTITTMEIVNNKNETLHTLAQNQYNLGPGGNPFGNNGLPPQLIAALQRRQQMLSQQSKCFRRKQNALLSGFNQSIKNMTLLSSLLT